MRVGCFTSALLILVAEQVFHRLRSDTIRSKRWTKCSPSCYYSKTSKTNALYKEVSPKSWGNSLYQRGKPEYDIKGLLKIERSSESAEKGGLLKIEEAPSATDLKLTKPYPPGRIKQSCSSSLSGVTDRNTQHYKEVFYDRNEEPKRNQTMAWLSVSSYDASIPHKIGETEIIIYCFHDSIVQKH